MFFFFQAEDGIRDFHVTGVQTCALPICFEAASKLRMEATSMPAELDEVRRRIMQLGIEREGLRKEKDRASKERLAKIEGDLAGLKEQGAALEARWQAERGQMDQVGQVQETC